MLPCVRIQVGWATFIGLAVMFLLGPMSGKLAAKLGGLRREILRWTDKRVSYMNELISGIQMIKVRAHAFVMACHHVRSLSEGCHSAKQLSLRALSTRMGAAKGRANVVGAPPPPHPPTHPHAPQTSTPTSAQTNPLHMVLFLRTAVDAWFF
jgi:hypothetical protein